MNDLHAVVVPLPAEALPRDGRAPLDPEAGRHAVDEYRAIRATGEGEELAVVLACLAYVRRQGARRDRWVYPLANGQRIPGVHPGMVSTLLHTLAYYGQLEGPAAEDAGARAIAAVFAWQERHEADERAHERRHGAHARQLKADLDTAKRRAQVHIANGGPR